MKEERLWSGSGKVIVDAGREARKRLHTPTGRGLIPVEMVVQKTWLDPNVDAMACGDQQPLVFECCEGKTSFGRESVFYF